MNVGDIVIFKNTKNVSDSDVGRYGRISENHHDYGVTVEVLAKVGNKGSLSFTAKRNDLEVVGYSSRRDNNE